MRWPDNKGNHINMHKVLISLAAELDISHIYEGLQSESMYTLVSAVRAERSLSFLCISVKKKVNSFVPEVDSFFTFSSQFQCVFVYE